MMLCLLSCSKKQGVSCSYSCGSNTLCIRSDNAITLNTDIREDLSNESMKMIVMISTIEDELDVTIEIQEASNLNTIGEFVNVVKERLGEETIDAGVETESAGASATQSTAAASDGELDDVAKTVIEAAVQSSTEDGK